MIPPPLLVRRKFGANLDGEHAAHGFVLDESTISWMVKEVVG
jgi:hypothetical protein